MGKQQVLTQEQKLSKASKYLEFLHFDLPALKKMGDEFNKENVANGRFTGTQEEAKWAMEANAVANNFFSTTSSKQELGMKYVQDYLAIIRWTVEQSNNYLNVLFNVRINEGGEEVFTVPSYDWIINKIEAQNEQYIKLKAQGAV